jgi:hypothetical protein
MFSKDDTQYESHYAAITSIAKLVERQRRCGTGYVSRNAVVASVSAWRQQKKSA